MILICHILLGALIGEKIKIASLAIIFAFFTHYVLDLIPHVDYSVENIKEKRWNKSLPDFLKVILDIIFGFALISIFSSRESIVFVGAFFAVLSDGLNFINFILPNKILEFHNVLHHKIHFLKDPAPEPRTRTSTVRDGQARYPSSRAELTTGHGGASKKIPIFWRVATQILFICLILYFL